ncbi:MAG: NINE protein [Alphaproteobacteria bacterium]|uniref:Putative TM2 domain-containing membrane protein n=1 Tax=viral metagenome TaxID=1070528 RepID=A0A6H1ZBC1_9ZZZZ|nr:NINE protein [Alphaproteobacteria bacterium]
MTNQGGLSADTQALMAFESNKKSAGVAYLLWFFTGGVGGHRFYMGRIGSAVTQLILAILGWTTVWFGVGLAFLIPLGIWLLIDVFTLGGMVAKHNSDLMARLNTMPRQAPSSADDLAKFAALRDSGAISSDEYEAEKRRILGRPADAI